MALLGLTGGAVLILNFVLILTGAYKNGEGPSGLLTLPEAAWEPFLGIYCAWRGFQTPSLIPEPASPPAERVTFPTTAVNSAPTLQAHVDQDVRPQIGKINARATIPADHPHDSRIVLVGDRTPVLLESYFICASNRCSLIDTSPAQTDVFAAGQAQVKVAQRARGGERAVLAVPADELVAYGMFVQV